MFIVFSSFHGTRLAVFITCTHWPLRALASSTPGLLAEVRWHTELGCRQRLPQLQARPTEKPDLSAPKKGPLWPGGNSSVRAGNPTWGAPKLTVKLRLPDRAPMKPVARALMTSSRLGAALSLLCPSCALVLNATAHETSLATALTLSQTANNNPLETLAIPLLTQFTGLALAQTAVTPPPCYVCCWTELQFEYAKKKSTGTLQSHWIRNREAWRSGCQIRMLAEQVFTSKLDFVRRLRVAGVQKVLA